MTKENLRKDLIAQHNLVCKKDSNYWIDVVQFNMKITYHDDFSYHLSETAGIDCHVIELNSFKEFYSCYIFHQDQWVNMNCFLCLLDNTFNIEKVTETEHESVLNAYRHFVDYYIKENNLRYKLMFDHVKISCINAKDVLNKVDLIKDNV